MCLVMVLQQRFSPFGEGVVYSITFPCASRIYNLSLGSINSKFMGLISHEGIMEIASRTSGFASCTPF